MRLYSFLIWQILFGLGLFTAFQSIAQPVVVIQNVKNACDGLNNGSFEILVTAANTPPLDATIFGPPNQGPFALTVGVPLTISNLPIRVSGYFVLVQDIDGSTIVNVPILGTPVNLSASLGATVMNTDCVVPNGSIDINVSGGSGSYSFQWTGPSGFTDPGTEDISGLSGGSYSVTVFDNNTNCTRSVGPVIITDPSPIPFNVSTSTPSVCLGDGATINLSNSEGPVVSYQVYRNGNPTGIFQSGVNGPIAFAIPPALLAPVATYAFTIEGVNGACAPVFMNGTANVVVNPLPTAVTSGGGTVCAGAVLPNVTFTFTGTAPFNFTYFDGTSSVNVVGHPTPTFTLTNAPAGTYSVTALSDATTCAATSLGGTVNVVVNPLPTAVASGGGTVCAGAPLPDVTFTFTGTAPFNFTYFDGTSSVNVVGHPTPTFTLTNAPAGTYSVTALSDANGCVGTALGGTVNVVVNPLPTAVTSGGGTVCAGAVLPNVTFTFTGTAPFNFTYFDGTSSVNVVGHPTPTFTLTNAPAGTYSVTALSDATTCAATSLGGTVNVVVNPLPTAVASGGGTVCAGAPLPDVTFTFTGTAPFNFTYFDGTSSVNVVGHPTPTFTLTNAPAGTYSVTALSDANGCVGTALGGTVNVIVNPLPTAVTSGGGTVCAGAVLPNVTFTFTGTAPFNFTYFDGTSSVNVVGHPTPTFTLTNAPAGTYSVTALSDATICAATSLGGTVNVVVNPLPTAVASGGGTVCAGAPLPDVTFTFTGTAPFNFTYFDGTSSVNVVGHPTPTFTLTNAPAGTYSVTALSDANGCVGTALGGTVNVIVNPLPTAVTSGGGTVCAGAVLPNVTFTFTGTAPFNFTYFDGTSSVNVVGHPTPTFTLTNAPAGTYSVTALSDATTCAATSLGGTVNVVVNPLPTAVASGGGTVCAGAPLPDVTFTFTGTAPFNFTYFDGTSSVNVVGHPTPTFTLTNAPAGTYSVTALSDTNGCVGTALGGTIDVIVSPLPTIALGANPVVCTGVVVADLTYSAVTGSPDQFRVDWNASAEAAGLVDVPATALPASPISLNNIPTAGGIYSGTLFVINSITGCESAGNVISVTVQQDVAVMSGNSSICAGTPALLTVTFSGPSSSWDFTYTDGSSNFLITANTNPFTFSVIPFISTTYSMVSVVGATCGAGSVSGSATVSVTPIGGNPSTSGSETWLGYAYDDSGNPAPPVSNIDFNNAKYRGFITDTDIAGISAFSSYNTVTDAFDLNLSNVVPLASPTICGTYLDDFSLRLRMTKTFAAGIYTFTVGADDGVRLWIDGVNILPVAAFNVHPFTVFTSTPQCLTAGTHDLVLEYFDRGGFSRLTFDFAAAPAPLVGSPVSVCVNTATPTLTASSAGAIDFNWYTDASLTNPPVFIGANYTPAPSELDMSAVGSTSFFVTAVFACGETPAAQVTVDVISGASITVPSSVTQICDSGGLVDLNTLVSAIPSGGIFTFSGTGIVISPDFDPSLVSGTNTITVDYVSGSCVASSTFDIEVVSGSSITVPLQPVTICESSGATIDLNTLVSASPSGGSFIFSGPGVTGSIFNPATLSGLVNISVDYSIGGCTAPTRTFDFDVVGNASITVDNSTIICSTDPLVNLLSLVTPNPTGGNFSFSGSGVSGNLFDPSTFAGSMATINVGYDFAGCLSSSTLQITVRSLADPLCGGPVITGNCNTVVITPMPSPAICSPTDGSIFFDIVPAVPTVNNTGVRIDIIGVSTANNGVALTNFNNPLFNGLPVGTYDYTIEYGDPSCTKTGQVTVLLGPDVVDFSLSSSNASCFGSQGGVVISTINGSSQADYTYEITQLGIVISMGSITQLESLGDVTLTGFGKGDFELKLSQDQSATTSCASPVQSAIKSFTVSGPDVALDTLFVKRKVSVPDLPTGSMTIGIQESLQEPYEVRLILTDPVFPGQHFAFDFTEVQRNPLSFLFEMDVKNIFAGIYSLSIRDSLGCQKDFQIVIDVDTNLMIPNVFTPNGDGVNEVFFIRNLPSDNSVFISNRWGKEVFSSRNYQNDWDGGSIEDGVYYYRIIVEGKAFSGWLEILRDK